MSNKKTTFLKYSSDKGIEKIIGICDQLKGSVHYNRALVQL